LPLHSPLLRQSLLVSFPPLIDMLKFSGYPHLIRGQTLGGKRAVAGRAARRPRAGAMSLLRWGRGRRSPTGCGLVPLDVAQRQAVLEG
jgi:hypothetical protein